MTSKCNNLLYVAANNTSFFDNTYKNTTTYIESSLFDFLSREPIFKEASFKKFVQLLSWVSPPRKYSGKPLFDTPIICWEYVKQENRPDTLTQARLYWGNLRGQDRPFRGFWSCIGILKAGGKQKIRGAKKRKLNN